MRKIIVFTLGFVLLLFYAVATPPEQIEASCFPAELSGEWSNVSATPQLVRQLRYFKPCNYRGEFSHSHDAVQVFAVCPTGTCNWGWEIVSPQSRTYAIDRRVWANARTEQHLRVLSDGRLQVTTIVTFTNGTERYFTDYLRKTSVATNGPHDRHYVELQIHSVEAKTKDGCGKNDFYAILTLFNFGTRRTQVFHEADSIYPMSWADPKLHWKIGAQVPLADGYVDATIRLMEYDNGFCGSDDHFDIHPNREEKDIHVRIYLKSREIYLVKAGNNDSLIGQIGDYLSSEGFHGEDRAKIIYRIDGPPATAQRLVLPQPPVAPAATPTPPGTGRRGEPTWGDLSSYVPPAGCQVPTILEFYPTAPSAGSTASFTLHYRVQGADRVEIFGNVLHGQSGTFDVWEENTANWLLWAKVNGTADNCYVDKGIWVTPGAILP